MTKQTFRVSFDVDFDSGQIPSPQIKETIRKYLWERPELSKLPAGITTVRMVYDPFPNPDLQEKVKLKVKLK